MQTFYNNGEVLLSLGSDDHKPNDIDERFSDLRRDRFESRVTIVTDRGQGTDRELGNQPSIVLNCIKLCAI